ncbi:Putative BTB/POZ domain-containing protein [Septoria linicola]|uniref:BTB/POZ domain-containing protein n=1 Tax=Septoria linicola TaxID=215465 RepID=A0A9Q9B1M5_9PEZI|nr:Putative BTB/POZ domain-containing protein [Septoria linicola]
MSDSIRAPKKRRFTGALITITVGRGGDAEKFYAHESLLKERSGFFQAALNQQWKEGRERKVDLPEDQPAHVATYIEWLFSGKIASQMVKPAAELTGTDIADEHSFLAHLYVLGEKLIDDKFCDDVMKAMAQLCAVSVGEDLYYPGDLAVDTIYKGTTGESPVRKFLVHIFKTRGKQSWIDLNEADWTGPVQFLLDIVRAQLPEDSPGNVGDLEADLSQWLKQK